MAMAAGNAGHTCLVCFKEVREVIHYYQCRCGSYYHKACKDKIQGYAGLQKFICRNPTCDKSAWRRGELNSIGELLAAVIVAVEQRGNTGEAGDAPGLPWGASMRESAAWSGTRRKAFERLMGSTSEDGLGVLKSIANNPFVKAETVHQAFATFIEVLTLAKPEEPQAQASAKEQLIEPKRTAIYEAVRAVLTSPSTATNYQRLKDWQVFLRGASGVTPSNAAETTQALIDKVAGLIQQNNTASPALAWEDTALKTLLTSINPLDIPRHPLHATDITDRTRCQKATWVLISILWLLWPALLCIHAHSKEIVASTTPAPGPLPPGPGAPTRYNHISTWKQMGLGGEIPVIMIWLIVLVLVICKTIFDEWFWTCRKVFSRDRAGYTEIS